MAGTIYWAERETEIAYPEVGTGGEKYRHYGATYRVYAVSASLTIPTVNEWLYGLLSADATITSTFGTRIHEGDIPQGVAYPALVYQFISGVPSAGIGSETIFTNMIYLVKAVLQGNSTVSVQAAMNRADALIHRTESVAVA